MKVNYYEETDSAYIRFQTGVVAEETTEVAPNINVDIAKDGTLIGIEIVSKARERLGLNNISIEQHAKSEVLTV